MKIKTLLSVITVIVLFLTLSCTTSEPGEIAADVAVQVIGQAAAAANPISPGTGWTTGLSSVFGSRAVSNITLTGPAGGTVSISYELNPDGSLTGTAEYTDIVIPYEGTSYTINGSYNFSMEFELNYAEDYTSFTMSTLYDIDGDIEISGGGNEGSFVMDMGYYTEVEYSSTTQSFSLSMTASGTMGDVTIPEETYTLEYSL